MSIQNRLQHLEQSAAAIRPPTCPLPHLDFAQIMAGETPPTPRQCSCGQVVEMRAIEVYVVRDRQELAELQATGMRFIGD